MSRQRGQSLVEAALVMPLLVFLLLLTIDVARLFSAYEGLTNAAHSVALYAARNPKPAAQTNAQWLSDLKTLAAAEGIQDPTNVAVNWSVTSGLTPYDAVTVTISYDFPLVVPAFTRATLHLEATAVEAVQLQ